MAEAPVLIFLAALCCDAAVSIAPGIRRLLDTPNTAITRFAGRLRAKLDRENRSPETRRWRGAIAVFLFALLGWGAGAMVAPLAALDRWGGFLEFIILLVLIRPMGLVYALRGAHAALDRNDQGPAAALLARLERAPSDQASDPAARLLTAGWSRFVEGVISATFWYLLLGLPGLFLARVISLVAGEFSRTDKAIGEFGLVPSRLEDVMTIFPGILAWPLVSIAAIFIAGCNPAAAFAGGLQEIARGWHRPGFRAEAALRGATGTPGGSAGLPRAVGLMAVGLLVAALLLAASILYGGR